MCEFFRVVCGAAEAGARAALCRNVLQKRFALGGATVRWAGISQQEQSRSRPDFFTGADRYAFQTNETMRFTDIHNHLLPGVDDGSRTLAETIRCLGNFRSGNVTEIVVTPHFVLHPELGGDGGLERRLTELRDAYAIVQEACAGVEGVPIVHFGQEVFAPEEAYIRPLLDHSEIGLAGTRFMLIEFGFDLGTRHREVIGAVRAAGREIVVAHPERYRFPPSIDPLETIRHWRDLGTYLQVNLGSLTGYYNEWNYDPRGLGWRLLEEGLAHVLASDDHGDSRPQIHHGAIFRHLAEHGGARQAEQLLGENPARILRGESPCEVAPLASMPHPVEAEAA